MYMRRSFRPDTCEFFFYPQEAVSCRFLFLIIKDLFFVDKNVLIFLELHADRKITCTVV
jgi:hypothetical protein